LSVGGGGRVGVLSVSSNMQDKVSLAGKLGRSWVGFVRGRFIEGGTGERLNKVQDMSPIRRIGGNLIWKKRGGEKTNLAAIQGNGGD